MALLPFGACPISKVMIHFLLVTTGTGKAETEKLNSANLWKIIFAKN